MRGWIVLLAVAALVAVDAWRASRPLAPPAASDGTDEAGEAPPAPRYPGFAEGLPQRDLFRYGAAPVPAPAAAPSAALATPPAAMPSATPRPAVRLVGLVRQDGELLAALSVFGRVAVLSAGQEVDGVAVLGVDEERGVRIRDAEGNERLLTQSR